MRKRFTVVLMTVAMLAAMAAPALAAIVPSFFSDNGGTAGFVEFTPAPPGAADTQSIALTIPDADAYAGFELTGIGTAAPSTAPSFDFRSTVASASTGGSPRLVIRFSDGGRMELRPLTWTANTWTTVSGSGNLWDNNGGTCGFLFGTTYAAGLACHTGATVTSAFIVTDSGWVVSPYTHYIDNVSYGNDTIGTVQLCNGLPVTLKGSGTINGTGGDDVIVGSSGADTINSGAGNDTICSGGGNDSVNGGTGNDTILGGAGNDSLLGGAGNDSLTGDTGSDLCNGGAGIDTAATCESTPNIP